MIFIDDTRTSREAIGRLGLRTRKAARKPVAMALPSGTWPRTMLARRIDRKRIRRRAEPVIEDATGRVIGLIAAIVAVLVLAFLASQHGLRIAAWAMDKLPAASAEIVTLHNPDSGLNVRKGPGKEYDAVFLLGDGADVTVLDTQNGYSLVAWTGYLDTREPMGWVCADYLAADTKNKGGKLKDGKWISNNE